jgi:hypothetical protein
VAAAQVSVGGLSCSVTNVTASQLNCTLPTTNGVLAEYWAMVSVVSL